MDAVCDLKFVTTKIKFKVDLNTLFFHKNLKLCINYVQCLLSSPKVFRYIGIFNRNAGFEVVPCNRYSGEERGAKVVATCEW